MGQPHGLGMDALFRRLQLYGPLEPDERRGLEAAFAGVRTVEANHDLIAEGALTDARRTAIAAKADAVAAEMRSGIVALDDPDPLTVFDNVYAEAHTGLARQRDHYSRYLRTFVGGDGR